MVRLFVYLSKRTRPNGEVYYSFSYTDDSGRRIRLKTSEHPYFNNEKDALTWAKAQEAYRVSKKASIERKLAWRAQYYDFEALVGKYEAWQKENAPRSYKDCVRQLNYDVLPFFLGVKKVGNINDWHLFFREFLDWIKVRPSETPSKAPLSPNTVNGIIKSLNTFINCMVQYSLIDPASAVKCPYIPEHKLPKRSIIHVIQPDEFERVYSRMLTINQDAAEFFCVLYHTGMRFNELFGLSISALFKGKITNESLAAELEKCDIDYIGYIYLLDQIDNDRKVREADGSLARIPLKSYKTISPKHARIIPIRTKEVWNILAKRYKAEQARLLKRTYTTNKADYVFFDDLTWSDATATIKGAYKSTGIKPKTYHCCRHSYTTMLVGETRSFFLTRMITGHKKDKSFEKYLHIFEMISMEAASKEQDIDIV